MSGPVGLAGRLAKLRAMSAAELLERVRYRTVIELERRQHRRGTLAPPDRLQRALRPDVGRGNWRQNLLASRRECHARFFPGVEDRDAVRTLFDTRFRAEREAAREHAGDVRAQRFAFFGDTFHYDGPISWQADPVSGQPWPSRFHADVPVHGGDKGFGDVKHVWELSRQQYLIDLAKVHFLDGDAASLSSLEHLVRSWIAGNPYATGVNWACALEPAFRAWSWLWAYWLTTASLDDGFHIEWLTGFYDHGRFLSRHLEHFSSPYNHLIGEASALYALGLSFPEFAASARWRAQARDVLEGRLADQFYPDGGTAEQSTFYHHATTGFYLLAALLGRVNGEEFSPAVWSAIARALDFSQALTQPDGRTPEIGGADDGKPIRLEHLPFWDFRPYLAIGAVVFARPDYKHTAGRFYEDALWLLGPAGPTRFDALPPAAPPQTATLLPSSGYAVTRSGWSSDADYVCFDVGEQAAGMRPDGIPNSMHGHADCLSVIVTLGGRRILVDSGLFAYNCGGGWEAHFRETAAHNTARVDRRNQAHHIGKMAWSHSYRAAVEGHGAGDDESWTLGSHDGFARGPDGVTHRRAVWRRPGGCVLIYDEFTGAGDHLIEVNFQFAPGTLADGDDHVVFDGFAELGWAGTGVWTPAIRHGGPNPDDGWICPSLGVRTAAPRLTLEGRLLEGRVTLLTALARRTGPGRRIATVRAAGAATLMAIDGGDHVDWAAARGVSDGGPVTTDGLVAVCRVTADGSAGSAIPHGGVRADEAALRRLSPFTHAEVR